MLQLVLAAPRSGSGKTTAACALLAALLPSALLLSVLCLVPRRP